jgi:hypothetical protein
MEEQAEDKPRQGGTDIHSLYWQYLTCRRPPVPGLFPFSPLPGVALRFEVGHSIMSIAPSAPPARKNKKVNGIGRDAGAFRYNSVLGQILNINTHLVAAAGRAVKSVVQKWRIPGMPTPGAGRSRKTSRRKRNSSAGRPPVLETK